MFSLRIQYRNVMWITLLPGLNFERPQNQPATKNAYQALTNSGAWFTL